MEHLDRDRATEAEVFGAIDVRHPTSAEHAIDSIPTIDDGTGLQHRLMQGFGYDHEPNMVARSN